MMCRFSMLKLTRIYPENRSTSAGPWSKGISELERSPFATGHKTLTNHDQSSVWSKLCIFGPWFGI